MTYCDESAGPEKEDNELELQPHFYTALALKVPEKNWSSL
jgi:hypothetical protein